MKKFFDKIKKDYKYKKAGTGRRLDEERVVTPQTSSTSTGSTGSASREYGTSAANAQAAAAAIARLEKKMMPKSASSMNKATLRAAREQNAQAKQGDKALVDSLQPPEEKKMEAAKILSVNGIYYTCPLSGEVIPKSDYVSHLETFLNSLEPVPSMETSVVKLNCLNTHRENREKAIEIIGKYLNNIKSNPDEDKYKKIKWNHKLFQEKVNSQKGATDFLKSIGWAEETLEGIPYLVYKGPLENIEQALIALQTDEIPRPTLHRMPKLLSPTDGQQRVELPDDFFKITGNEVKKLHADKNIQSQQLDMLMTQKMREDAALLNKRTYCYSLIRIRMPDSDYLQGTFNVYEKSSTLLDFVKENIIDDFNWVPFKLRSADGTFIFLENKEVLEKTIAELSLVPSATLTFCFYDDEIREQLPRKLIKDI